MPAPELEYEMLKEEIRELAAKEYEVAISRVLDILEIIANEIGR